MSIDQFPEIETCQKLPRKVIVKGGNSGFNAKGQPELRGIVINNAGHSIRDIKVFLVLFNVRVQWKNNTHLVPVDNTETKN